MTETIPVDFPLSPKARAVIVGASSGIGEAIARKLTKEGYIVALLARRKDKLDAVCAQINAEAGETRAVAYKHDVSKLNEIPQTFQLQ